ncbi:MAG: hypothetical protein GWP03_01635 [Proteobacteria bacterium]|nr:hypothetical protein [Pseudomonadota bacterium]
MIISNDDILKITKRFADDFLEGLNRDVERLSFAPKRIFYTGMGGSGVCGEVLKDILSTNGIPVYTNHGYGYFDGEFRDRDLHLFSSYSGNTEETLSAFEEAGDLKNRYVISSGGKLTELAQKAEVPILQQKEGYQPRLIFPYTLGLVLNMLRYLEKHDYDKNIITDKLRLILENDSLNKKSEILANAIKDKLVVLYSSFNIHGVTLRFSAQLNENSKLFVHSAFFSECNHNEILSIKHLAKLPSSVIFIKSKYDNDRIKLRMSIIEKMLKENGVDVNNVEIKSDNFTEEVISLIFFLDLLSVRTAIKCDVAAGDIEEIENLKKELAKK